MLNKSGAKLNTWDLQFAYETGMSTTMCSTVLKEVVQYTIRQMVVLFMAVYLMHLKPLTVKYDKLFPILLERRFSVIY